MDNNTNLLNADLQVDSMAVTHLKETAMWAKFLGIVGLVISIIIAIFSFFAGTFIETYSRGQAMMPLGTGITLTVVYLIFAAIYFFLSLFLFRFATKMKQALLATDQDSFNTALYNLKLSYRIMGAITAIYLAFVALAIVVGIGAAMFAS